MTEKYISLLRENVGKFWQGLYEIKKVVTVSHYTAYEERHLLVCV